MKNILPEKLKLLNAELKQLNETFMVVEGRRINPGSCYHFESSPPHVLYNINCPQVLKEKIETILTKYITGDESSTS